MTRCGNSTSEGIRVWHTRHRQCPQCNTTCSAINRFIEVPKLIAIEMPGLVNTRYAVSKTIKTLHGNNTWSTLSLRGVIYLGGSHFVSRIITNNQEVWYNDGMQNSGRSRYECKLNEISVQDLEIAQNRKAVVAVYAR